MSGFRLFFLGLCCIILLGVAPGAAGKLPLPTDTVILRLDGNVTSANIESATVFDLEMLKALGGETFKAKTEWTKGMPTFTGVPLSALMDKVGASGSEIIATAADGYAISIPMIDLERFTLLLVYAIDGVELDPIDKGPLWIMYRWDQMTDQEIEDKSPNAVWQLQQLTFE